MSLAFAVASATKRDVVGQTVIERRAAQARSRGSLGRKGLETRARLLAATRKLLEEVSPFSLTVAAITREARTVLGTFYVYFSDAADIFHALCEESRDDFVAMARSHPEWFERRDRIIADVQQLVDEFNRIWDRHGHVLQYRNLESSRGNLRFQEVRTASAAPIIDRLALAVIKAQPELAGGQAFADAVVLYAGIEQVAASRLDYGPDRPGPSDAELVQGIVRIIAKHLNATVVAT